MKSNKILSNFVILAALVALEVGGAWAQQGTGITNPFPSLTGSVSSSAPVRVPLTGITVGNVATVHPRPDSVKIASGNDSAAARGRFYAAIYDSVASKADSVLFRVSPVGIVGIRTSGISTGRFDSIWTRESQISVDSFRTSINDSVIRVTLTPRLATDTLIIFPLGYRTGTVNITARKFNATDNLITLTTYVVTVGAAAARPTVTGVTVIGGLDREEGADSAGQVLVRATGTTNGYKVHVVDSLHVGTTGLKLDTLSAGSDDSIATTGSSGAQKVRVTGLDKGKTYRVLIRGTYTAPWNEEAAKLFSAEAQRWSPPTVVDVKTPADLKPQNSNNVSYSTVTGMVYNGLPRDLGRASLVSGITDLTYSGLDPWDTLYSFKKRSDDIDKKLDEGLTGVYDRFASAARPKDAGVCTTWVRFNNSQVTWVKQAVFNVAPRALRNDDIQLTGPTTFVYNANSQHPGYIIQDGGNPAVPADRKMLALGKDYHAAQKGTGTNTDASDSTGNPDAAYINDVNVGTAASSTGPKVRILGVGNYTGIVSKGFAITAKALAVDTAQSSVTAFNYTGSKTVDSSLVSVKFHTGGLVLKGLTSEDEAWFNANAGDSAYKFTATLDNADVSATTRKATVQVSLGNGTKAKNYSLTAADGKFEKNIVISPKGTLDSTDFKFAIPQNDLYTGLPRTIGPVTFAFTQPTGTANIKVIYNGDTTVTPNAVGTYTVTARIDTVAGKVSNYVNGSTYALGTYEIGAPLAPVIDSSNIASRTVRSGVPFSFVVNATSPNSGTLIYRWYRNDTLIAGQTGNGRNTYSPVTTPASLVGTSAEYYVKVINSVPGVQVNDTLDSEKATITVDVAPKSLTQFTKVTVDTAGLIYNGEPQIPSGVIVEYSGAALSEGTDYTLVYANNLNAGSGFVYVIGLDAYKDTAMVQFPIRRKTLERSDFYVELEKVYNGTPQALTALITEDPVTQRIRERMGTPTFRYNGATTAPTNAGTYGVTVTFAQGLNFTASDSAFVLDSLVVLKKGAVASDFSYAIPTGHTYTGQAQGIGAVTLKAPLNGAGALKVLYDYDEALPINPATYTVAVEVEGGANFTGGVVPLGSYRIASDVLLVSEARQAIESSGYGPATQEEAGTSAAAVAFVTGVIDSIDLAGVTATVKPVTFTAPVAGTEDAPNGTVGSLAFTVSLEKGNAKDSTIVLTLVINPTRYDVSVASGDRVIPGKSDGSAVVAPVAVVAGEFTVGPNPVVKSGKVGFFWNGGALKSGTLYVYDASGSLVTKVAVSGTGKVGEWGLDSKGRPVAEGTYLVKGALVTKAGSKVKVASVIGVAK